MEKYKVKCLKSDKLALFSCLFDRFLREIEKASLFDKIYCIDGLIFESWSVPHHKRSLRTAKMYSLSGRGEPLFKRKSNISKERELKIL